MKLKLFKAIIIFSVFTFNINNESYSHGFLKKKNSLSVSNTTIIRNDGKEAYGFRNDTLLKYGITDWFTLASTTSIIHAESNKLKDTWGLNYQQLATQFQIFKHDKSALSLSLFARTGSYYNGNAGDFFASKLWKIGLRFGYDYKITSKDTIMLLFEYRYFFKDDYIRLKLFIDYKHNWNDKLTTSFFFRNFFYIDMEEEKSNATSFEVNFNYKITKKISLSAGIGYYLKHKDTTWSFKNITFILGAGYSFF